MILPIRTDSPLRSTPWVNLILIGLNVVCFILQRAVPQHTFRLELSPQYPELYQFVTYAFLHGDALHIFGNMLFLYIFGNNVNDKMGNGAYLAYYLAGAIFAGLGHSITSDGRVIGASGAVSAVTGAYLILLPRSHITVFYFFYLIGTFELPSMWFILFFFLKDVMLSYRMAGNVAYMAHISGTLFGVVICFLMLAVNMLPRDQFDVLAILKHRKRRWDYQNLVRGGYDPFAYDKAVRNKPERDPTFEAVQDIKAQISEAISHNDLPSAADLYIKMKQLDARAVLSRQAQLDIANQLASQQLYPQAAEAYEAFLQQYPNFDQVEQVELMAGIIYSRYLQQYDRAKQHLLRALARLHGENQVELAKSELSRIEPFTGTNPA